MRRYLNVYHSGLYVAILEVSRETELEEACEIMGRTPDWLPGIELRADGFIAEFYQK